MICKWLKVPSTYILYKIIESLVVDVELKGRRAIVAGLYRPPKSLVSTYQLQLEEEINQFCNWASLQGHVFVFLGDLNLDRLCPDKPEGKLLIDIEETHGLECVITDWKKGEWTPVHKKDDQLQKENYRPVTVQIVINKIFEQLLSSQITGHFNNRLCDHLTAYRKRHSCETTLLYLTESWRHSLDNGECVGVLSTDMSKAFDCLFPPLMLAKLKVYNFDDVSLKLMAPYFENRQARVKLGNTTSGWRKVERGVPSRLFFWAFDVESLSEWSDLSIEVEYLHVCRWSPVFRSK